MSAIAGVLRFDEKPVSESDGAINGMLDAMAEYGPEFRNRSMAPPMAMGYLHRTVTPEGKFEKQPLALHGKYLLVADARIDNPRELAGRLDIPVNEIHHLPDSFFILKAYEKYGEDCPNHLQGDFAFFIWDRDRRVLFGARDPLGQRVAFYHHSSRFFAFATAPMGLFALPGVPRKVNERQVAFFLSQMHSERPEEFFYKDVQRLPAGYTLKAGSNGVQLYQYWRPDRLPPLEPARQPDHIEAFDDLLRTAVQCRMRTTRQIGLMMSGGLDSTSVAAVLSEIYKKKGTPLKVFSSIPAPGQTYPVRDGYCADESSYIKAVAQKLGNLDVEWIYTGKGGLFQDTAPLFSYLGAPFRNLFNLPWVQTIYQKAALKGINVLMTGDSGNFTISWEGKIPKANILVSKPYWREWGHALFKSPARSKKGAMRRLLRPLIPIPVLKWRYHSGQGLLEQWKRITRIIDRDLFREACLEERYWERTRLSFEDDPRQRLFSHIIPRSIGNDLKTALKARYGIESRDPLGDVRIVEFCLRMPWHHYYRNGKKKQLVRTLMQNRLPGEVLEAVRGRGFQAADWFRTVVKSWDSEITPLLDKMNSSPMCREILNLETLNKLFSQNRKAALTYRDLEYPLHLLGLAAGKFITDIEAQTQAQKA